MATISHPGFQIRPRPAVWALAGLLLIDLALILLVRVESLRTVLTDLWFPMVGMLSATALFYTAWKVRSTSPRFALAWLILALSCLCWALGDTFWAVLEVFLRVQPFPSIADVFYLAYYPLLVVGFLIIPHERLSLHNRLTAWLDIGIVFLAAALLYWNFLIGPMAVFEQTDLLTFLIGLAYPVFDLVLFTALMLLLYRKQTLLNSKALFLLATSIGIQIISDTNFGLQSIAGTYVSGGILDMSWQAGLVTFGLAGLFQIQSMAQANQGLAPGVHTAKHRLRRLAASLQLDSWLAFSPYLGLAAAYWLLIYAEYNPLPMRMQSIFVVSGVLIALILTRQAISISDIRRLSEQLKLELLERQRTQELLRKSHDELEQHTIALTRANEQLESEIEERRCAEARLENSLHEKDVLLKEIHHRVKNNLQVISSMLKLQSNKIKYPAVTQALMDSQNRVQSMALIHEKLYQSTSLANIDFSAYLESLVSFLHRSYNSNQKQASIRVEVEPVTLGIDLAVPCGLIVNELVSNALKHAFPDRSGGEITVQLKVEGNNQLQLVISDDGIGIPESVDIQNSPSLGLQLVNALVNQLDGKLEFERNHGTRVAISFPATQPVT